MEPEAFGTKPTARKKATIIPIPAALSTGPLAGILISAKGCSFAIADVTASVELAPAFA